MQMNARELVAQVRSLGTKELRPLLAEVDAEQRALAVLLRAAEASERAEQKLKDGEEAAAEA